MKSISQNDLQELISKNLFISVSAKIFYVFTRLFIPPLALSFVTLEEYGLWAICFVIISYFNLGAFGVANVYIRYVASYHATNEINKINGLVSTGIVLVTIINFMFLLALLFLLPTLIENIFTISPTRHATAFLLFYGTACIFLFALSFNAFIHILNGLQKIAETALVGIFCLILEIIFLVIFFLSGFGILSLLYAFIIRTLLSLIIYIYLSSYYLPGLSIGFTHFDRSYFKLFYRFGAIVQFSSILGLILRTIDKLMTSTVLGMKATALIDLGTKLPTVATSITGSMDVVFLPAISYMHSQQRYAEIINTYLRGSRTISLLIGIIMGFLAAFSMPLVVGWLGTAEKYQIVAIILAFFTLPMQLHALTGTGTAYFRGIEKPMMTLIYSGGRLLLVGIIALLIFSWFEITIFNIAMIMVLATALGALFYIGYTVNFIGIPLLKYVTQVMLPGFVIPYGIAHLLFWLLTPWANLAMEDRWYAIGFIVVSGIIYVVLTLSAFYWGILTSEEKQRLHQQVNKFGRLFSKKANHV
jgi:O-antigen/teichoic acid export membrane protein